MICVRLSAFCPPSSVICLSVFVKATPDRLFSVLRLPFSVICFNIRVTISHYTILSTNFQAKSFLGPRLSILACTQARISYNEKWNEQKTLTVVACTQTRISYNFNTILSHHKAVVACTQTRISYNIRRKPAIYFSLWLALRHGSVIIRGQSYPLVFRLWLALRHGSVIMPQKNKPLPSGVVACTQARISYNNSHTWPVHTWL